MRCPHAVLGALALLALAAVQPARAEGFISTYEDLPLAPGLTELAGRGHSFDSPGGRLIEAYASGSVKPAEVLGFYAATLPQLGWVRETDTRYHRDAEILDLDPKAQGKSLVVRFAISPE